MTMILPVARVLSDARPMFTNVTAGLWTYSVPFADGDTRYTTCVIGIASSGAVTLVDPGTHHAGGVERMSETLRSIGAELADVERIVLTHSHHDHSGAVAGLQRKTGAEVLMHGRDHQAILAMQPGAGRDDSLWEEPSGTGSDLADAWSSAMSTPHGPLPDAFTVSELRDGEMIDIGPSRWQVIWTPGHTPGHICLVDHANEIIITGDHVLPDVFPGLGLSMSLHGNPVQEYLNSLEKLSPSDGYDVIPGHGAMFRGLAQRRGEIRDHVLKRSEEVEGILARTPAASILEIASRMTWTSGWERLKAGPNFSSALWQTHLYRSFVLGGGLTHPPEAA